MCFIIDSEKICLIPLSGKKGKGFHTKVSSERFDYLNQFDWYLNTNGYVNRNKNLNKIKHNFLIHREIMSFPDRKIDIDHKDGDKLNNVDSNLRLATRSQNNANRKKIRKNKSSKYTGVTWNKNRNKWTEQIQFNNKRYGVGYFNSKVDAARARDGAALVLHGEFANLVVPELDPTPFIPPKPLKKTSLYKGVGWSNSKLKWRAYTTENNKFKHLGYSETEEGAFEIYENYLKTFKKSLD